MPLEDQIEPYKSKYAPATIKDFYLYWSEGDRWKKEKVFDISKRLERWTRQEQKWQYEKEAKQSLKIVDEMPKEKTRTDSSFTSLSSLFNKKV